MLTRGLSRLALVTGCAVASIMLAGCGGGGGGGVGTIPPPPPSPTPTPTPTPTPSSSPLPPAHLGLVSSKPFAALGVVDSYASDASSGTAQSLSGPSLVKVEFSYDAATNTYQISVPNFQSGTLASTQYSGSAGQTATSTTSQVTAGTSTTLQPLSVTLLVPGSDFSRYSYTSYGWWDGKTGQTSDGRDTHDEGIFVYGIPTASGDVPVTGSATYLAEIHATTGTPGMFPEVGGDVSLLFNFAAGTLSGSMHPQIADSFDGIFFDFGTYEFTQTVYATGSNSFSGKFVVPGMPGADSSFNGVFTGPGAAELMAQFTAPYLDDGKTGTISGIWIGKKQ